MNRQQLKTLVFGELRRYLTVGAGAAATDFLTYALLTRSLGMDPLAANLISRPLGGLFSFIFNRAWTFRNHRAQAAHVQFLRFWILWLVTYALSEALVGLFNRIAGLGPLLTKMGAESVVGLFNFLVMRHWTFR